MLKPIIEYVKAAYPSVASRQEAQPRAADAARPVWDNGTDYDIPTYLRRDRARARRLVRQVPARHPRYVPGGLPAEGRPGPG